MSAARVRLAEFFATLDVAGDEPLGRPPEELPESLRVAFPNPKDFFDLASRLQSVGLRSDDEQTRMRELEKLVEADPRLFLVLSHLHRQLRFTNVELARLLFDPSRLDDPSYYRESSLADPAFAKALQRAEKWKEVDLSELDANTATLVAGKRAIFSYMGSEETNWEDWLSRLRSDPDTRTRVIQYLFSKEDLGELISEQAVGSALKRSLRTTNVEQVKSRRGTFGARRVRAELTRAGFQPSNLDGGYVELESLPGSVRGKGPGRAYFAAEAEWEGEKRFDFALFNEKGVRFVIETTYYSTSMSKIGEVVRHFEDLREQCSDKFHLFFLTDGVGWFGKTKDVKRMLAAPDSNPELGMGLPYLLTYHQFEGLTSTLLDALKHSEA